MDPACDVMLAYEQNGEKLQPDHGFPLRLIIPGYIGGRMIKWLNEITVTSEESDNHFHFNDNRVLPEHVTAEIANAEGWWYKPDYIINELNINSAIAYPGHLEVLPISRPKQTYTIKGYCYTGGGRKVIRVEVSIDGGKTWTLTKLHHPEKPTEYGRYWCWAFFEHGARRARTHILARSPQPASRLFALGSRLSTFCSRLSPLTPRTPRACPVLGAQRCKSPICGRWRARRSSAAAGMRR